MVFRRAEWKKSAKGGSEGGLDTRLEGVLVEILGFLGPVETKQPHRQVSFVFRFSPVRYAVSQVLFACGFSRSSYGCGCSCVDRGRGFSIFVWPKATGLENVFKNATVSETLVLSVYPVDIFCYTIS